MNNLEKLGLVSVLTEEVIDNKKPYFGICLGLEFLLGRMGLDLCLVLGDIKKQLPK